VISNIYAGALLISLGCLVYLSQKKDRPVDRYYWTVMILIPVIILGYWLKTKVHTPEAAMIAFSFIYVDSTILLAVAYFSIMRSIRAKVSALSKVAIYGITIFHLFTIWLSKDNNLYYETIELINTGSGTATKMVSGPLKITHYIYLGFIFLAIINALVYGLVKKETYSKRNLWYYSGFAILSLFVYVYEMVVDVNFSVLPVLYTFGALLLTFCFEVFQSHNIHSLIGEKQSRTGKRGFVAFNKHKKVLGYNTQFANVFPDIEKVIIDNVISDKFGALKDFVNPLLDRCIEQGNYTDTINYNGRIYSIEVSSFSLNSNYVINGYLLELSDVTEEKERIGLIEKFNERLSEVVEEKTASILDIQNSVVLGMANLVENRDNNTGGHVKRTSDVIKLLVEEAKKQQLYEIDDEKAADIVRAAPMHDLGKMYIATEILCKPGKLTDEEFLIMKSHAPKSGEMVKIILEGVEEPHFVNTAYNLARHHHERWDGRGYPEGLMGEHIPLEARIMAVADVYDALVSKRCYKEAMSFEVASKIMNDNMGSQFDPAMRPIFNACREKLEEYYTNSN